MPGLSNAFLITANRELSERVTWMSILKEVLYDRLPSQYTFVTKKSNKTFQYFIISHEKPSLEYLVITQQQKAGFEYCIIRQEEGKPRVCYYTTRKRQGWTIFIILQQKS